MAEFPLIHVGRLWEDKHPPRLLFLREVKSESSRFYQWFAEAEEGTEVSTPVQASNPREAIRLANQHWGTENFSPIPCGFRFTLPERDEVGGNALFHQMAASYSSGNGSYFDKECGHLCVVHGAPEKTLDLLRRLKSEGKT